jgi:hypothetical protein
MLKKGNTMLSKQTLITLPVLLLAGAMLTGCNSDAPSASDAQRVTESIFSGCDQLKVVDYERVNGIPQNDGTYIVQVKYNVRISPTPENKQYIAETYPKLYADVKEKVEHGKAVRQKYETSRDQFMAANPGKSITDFEKAYPDIANDYYANISWVGDSAEQRLTEGMPSSGKTTLAQNLWKTCPKLGIPLINKLFQHPASIEQYTSDVDVPFSDSYIMIKTDNGWMAQQ